MKKLTALVACVIALASFGRAAQADLVSLEALEAGSGLCGLQGACFLAGNWFTQTSYDSLTNTVTGSGTFSTPVPVSGSQSVYIIAGPGNPTILDILTMNFSASDGTTQAVTASYQASDSGAIDLGAVPSGGVTIVGDGSLQDVTSLLNAQGGFPADIKVEAQDVPAPAPEPASLALLGVALAGLGWLRSRSDT